MSTTKTEQITRTDRDWGYVLTEKLTSGRGAVTFRVNARLDTKGDGLFDDYYEADTIELARAVASAAEAELNAHRRPNLKTIGGDLKRRDGRLVGTERRVFGGGVVLGDTAPDERPAS